MTEQTRPRRRAPVVTAVPPGALESTLRDGLLSAQEVAKRPELLQLARPDATDREAWVKRLETSGKDPRLRSALKGPSVSFSPPPKSKIAEDHPIRKWGLIPVRVDLDRLRRDDPSLRVYGVELTPASSGPVTGRQRELSPEEVDALRRTPPRELWKHYTNTRYYSADVPHAALINSSGRIPPKYLRVMGRRPLEKTAGGVPGLEFIGCARAECPDCGETWKQRHCRCSRRVHGDLVHKSRCIACRLKRQGERRGDNQRHAQVEKTADKNNPGKITKMLKAAKPNFEGFAPKAYVKGTAKKSYIVGTQKDGGWRCTCPDWTHRRSKTGGACKHIALVQSHTTKRGKK